MKLNFKTVALPALSLAAAFLSTGAQAALLGPATAGGSDIILNVWDPDNADQGDTQDLGVQIGNWNPNAAFSLNISNTGVLAAYNSGAMVWDVIASRNLPGTGAYYTTVSTNNPANYGAGAFDNNFSVSTAVQNAPTVYADFASKPGNTFAAEPGYVTSASSDGYWAASFSNGGGSITAVTEGVGSSAIMYFASFEEGPTDPIVNIFAGSWQLAFNGAVGAATGATLTWTPTGAPVPIPAALWLLGSGLAGLAGIGRRRKMLAA